MVAGLSMTQLKPSPDASNSLVWRHNELCRLGYCHRNLCSEHRLRFKILGQSPGDRWKLNYIDANAVQQRLNTWVSNTQNFFSEALVKTGQSRKPDSQKSFDNQGIEDIFIAEQTIDSRTPTGNLSVAAIVSIEQFSRMNGLTGQKAQKIFRALVSEPVNNDGRNLVEYCCFRFLSRDNSDIHPCLKEPAFQRLIFITMLAWENPYCDGNESGENFPDKAFFQGKLVGKEAFVRITPAVSGLADRVTVHNLFQVLAGDEQGISLSLWLTYIDELLKVYEGRNSYKLRENSQFSQERILCTASSRKKPVIKWENNMAWPGKLTLTDTALYFEAVGLLGPKDAMRYDLTRYGLRVEKAKVGPLGSILFDSAVSVSSGLKSETWVLEFIDFGGELRRDVWYAFISEVIACHKFIKEFGPRESDQSIFHVYGAPKGKEKAVTSAIRSIARLQALQFMHKLLDDPVKLVQFSYLQSAPYGDVVSQTLAVNFWGGPLITKFKAAGQPHIEGAKTSDGTYERSDHVFDLDGSVYLRKWMRSPSWASAASITFWKNSSTKDGVILSKNLVVAGLTLVEKAAITCQEKSQAVEKTQATIDAAMVKGIPSNIDLFKELLLPLVITAKNFDKLRRWEEPPLTVSFLLFAYTIIFRNLLSYVFPVSLMVLAAGMLTLKGLKEQGRLGKSFGRVTIHDQPPSNTIQKIIAVKDAMLGVESYLQNLNVTLLKIRSIFLAGQPQMTTEVALVFLSSATILLIVPFKYILAFLICDLFTRELDFRREMVKRFKTLLKERWDTIPAAPVVVLPFESQESKEKTYRKAETFEKTLEKKLEQMQE